MLSFKKLPLFLLLIALISCKNQDVDAIETTWIGGQIINPKMDYVIFSQGSKILDTVKLDSNNFFLYRTEKVTSGLYSFRHYENQIMYLEPGDSLMLYLNTMDFDESLAYSGKGAERNNLLMDFFLSNEIEIHNIPKWYSLPPTDFLQKIDSTKKVKTEHYKEYRKNNEVTEDFDAVIQANLMYHYYSQKELYITANSNQLATLPPIFFKHRKTIDFNNRNLRFYYPYYRFLYRYINNLAIEDSPSLTIDRSGDFDYNYKKIKLIDSLIPLETLKNSFLRHTTIQYILNATVAEEQKQFFNAYSKMTTNQSNIDEIQELVKATVKLTPGNLAPDIALVNSDGVSEALKDIIKAPTVVFFWSTRYAAQSRNSHHRAAELKVKYPEYDFIGINTDSHAKNWRATIKREGYDRTTEFQLENLSDAQKTLVLNSLNKVIIINKDKRIVEGNCSMYHSHFESILLENLNK